MVWWWWSRYREKKKAITNLETTLTKLSWSISYLNHKKRDLLSRIKREGKRQRHLLWHYRQIESTVMTQETKRMQIDSIVSTPLMHRRFLH